MGKDLKKDQKTRKIKRMDETFGLSPVDSISKTEIPNMKEVLEGYDTEYIRKIRRLHEREIITEIGRIEE